MRCDYNKETKVEELFDQLTIICRLKFGRGCYLRVCCGMLRRHAAVCKKLAVFALVVCGVDMTRAWGVYDMTAVAPSTLDI